MQVADKDGLRQIASEKEFKSLVIECGLNQPRTVSLKNLFFLSISTNQRFSVTYIIYNNSVYYSIL